MTEFPKRFDFREAEPRLYDRWLAADAFASAWKADGTLRDPSKKDAKPFVIVIPPPNITGRLHMGHALNNTVQDVLIRHHRMLGEDALWIPGTDHAGIATQTVVKKQLDAQGIDYRALGRDEVVKRIWQWRDQYGSEILKQLRRMGCSCDWSRTRFTMDEGLNLAVRESFVQLYERGLIYRGKRIVNWCPVDRTALSDDEVEKEEVKGKMYRIRYPIQGSPGEFVVVATTRPETLFGDVAVAVHPKNAKLAQHIGKNLVLPLQGRIIPVIGDEWADPEKGTGAVKITPAHDPNDFEVGLRHKLTPINVMNEDATLNEIVPTAYQGLDRYVARKKALAELEELGLLEGVDDHMMAIGSSYRSRVPIEYRLSDQWFVRMTPMADEALKRDGYDKTADGWEKTTRQPETLLHPERFDKVYFHWLSNIRDWCISRQIWWGHRIPAWYNTKTGEMLVAREAPAAVTAAPEDWKQDEDVLDTWFSSWLWPMSTLGWPNKTPDYDRYYPTSVLSTAKDILFFWVARMNFAGTTFDGRMPYEDVYLHSTVADVTGTTMSKSKGNGIDPLTLIDGATMEDLKKPVFEARPNNMKELINRIEKTYPSGFEAVGADAMRWTLIYSITEGENVKLSLDRFTEGRGFVTKLWNASGRIITALEEESGRSAKGDPAAPRTDEDEWLLARLDTTTREVKLGIEGFDFGAVAQSLYHFVWDDFCSWALELTKPRLIGSDAGVRRGALSVMGSALADLLRLLHPIIPFVTEELWTKLVPLMDAQGLWIDGQGADNAILCLDRQPLPRKDPQPEIEARFAILQRFVNAARSLRSASDIKDNVKVTALVKPIHPDAQPMLERAKGPVSFLARLDDIQVVDKRSKGMAASFDPAFELYVDLAKYVDLGDEIKRLEKAVDKTAKEVAGHQTALANPAFIERAPPEKVVERKAQLTEAEERHAKQSATLAELREAAAG